MSWTIENDLGGGASDGHGLRTRVAWFGLFFLEGGRLLVFIARLCSLSALRASSVSPALSLRSRLFGGSCWLLVGW